ncbi:MAG: hypothetical protein WCX65_09575, partial [bacterium]
AFLDVEDFTGKISVSVGPAERTKYASEIRQDNIIAVKGWLRAKQIDSKDENGTYEFRVNCGKLESFLQGPDTGKKSEPVKRRIHFRIATGDDPARAADLIRELKTYLSVSRGSSEVFIHLDENGEPRKFQLPDSSVRYSPEFLRMARRIFGENNVWVETDRA